METWVEVVAKDRDLRRVKRQVGEGRVLRERERITDHVGGESHGKQDERRRSATCSAPVTAPQRELRLGGHPAPLFIMPPFDPTLEAQKWSFGRSRGCACLWQGSSSWVVTS